MDVKRKITVSIGVFSSILIIIIIYFVYSDASYLLQENQKEIMNIQLDRVSENISYLMEVNEKETEKLSIDTQVDNYFYKKITSRQLNEYLIELMNSKNEDNYYKDFFILNKDGKMVSTTMKSAEHLDLSTRPYFKLAKENRKTVSSNILIAKSDGELIVITLTPIMEKKNIIAYAGIAIKAEFFSKFINKIKLGNNGYYIIVDSNGFIISHPNKELITTNIQNLNISNESN
ncbi:cache domain-containing protein, partial [Clostridiaceae bacterium HSG29]|nr:cache domain-containing protein [Clostridiaceae bacterium HSG29]